MSVHEHDAEDIDECIENVREDKMERRRELLEVIQEIGEDRDSESEDDSSDDMTLIVDILKGISSSDPEDIKVAVDKAQVMIEMDDCGNESGSGDFIKPEPDTFICPPVCETKVSSCDEDFEGQVIEKDFWKGLSPQEGKQREGSWEERKYQSDILRQQGNISCVKGDYEEAIRCYSEAIELIRDSACLYNNRALAYMKLGKYEAAVGDCDKAIFISESSLKARLYKAKALYKSRKHPDCLACLQEARAALPNFLRIIDHCEKALFDSKTCTREDSSAKARDDVLPTEKFMRLAAQYNVTKMSTFFDESPVAKGKR